MDADSHLTLFKAWMGAKGHPADTIGTYLSWAKRFFDYFSGEDHPKNISTHQLIAFLASITEPHTRKSVQLSSFSGMSFSCIRNYGLKQFYIYQ